MIVLSENFKTLAELILCFFACVGFIYLLQDIAGWVLKNKKKTHATAIIDLSKSQFPIHEIVDFAVYYHTTHAERYIQKVIIIGAPDYLTAPECELEQVLRMPIEFDERN